MLSRTLEFFNNRLRSRGRFAILRSTLCAAGRASKAGMLASQGIRAPLSSRSFASPRQLRDVQRGEICPPDCDALSRALVHWTVALSPRASALRKKSHGLLYITFACQALY